MGSSSTLVVVEWNSPQSYRYFDDVTIFFRILHLSENLLLCLSHSAVLDKKVTLCIRQKKLLSVLHKKSTMAFLSYMAREPQGARKKLRSSSFASSLIKENPLSFFVLFFILGNFNFFTYD